MHPSDANPAGRVHAGVFCGWAYSCSVFGPHFEFASGLQRYQRGRYHHRRQHCLTPTSLSLNSGQVSQIVATPKNSDGNAIVADVSFTSSNSNLISITAGGLRLRWHLGRELH